MAQVGQEEIHSHEQKIQTHQPKLFKKPEKKKKEIRVNP